LRPAVKPAAADLLMNDSSRSPSSSAKKFLLPSRVLALTNS
jgi:hypothetical protein